MQKIEIKRKENLENKRIDKFIPALLKKYEKGASERTVDISEIYADAVGAEISAKTSVVKFRDGKLTVKISDPILKVEFKFMEEEIKKSINSRKNTKVLVEKIIFK